MLKRQQNLARGADLERLHALHDLGKYKTRVRNFKLHYVTSNDTFAPLLSKRSLDLA